LLAGVRIIDGLGTRNRVYREAHQVQGQLRAYYDARIETAQRQMIEREQLGLRDSQFEAYKRVKASLEAERDVAIQLTEDEKRAAKYTFEGRLRRELLGAVARSPKGQTALRDIRGALSDVRDRFGQLQAVLEGGNPISIAAADLQREVDRLRSAGAVISLLSGPAGAELQRKAEAVQGLIDQVTGATAEAAAASQEALDTLDSAIGSLDQHIESPRRARAAADLLAEEAVDAVLDTIFTPGGETPAEDVVADAIARGIDRNLVQNVGVALGELDPDELRTMRERIRAQLLRDRLDRIAAQCGRFTGDSLRATLDALRDGSAPPESAPCPLFQNPERLEEFIRDFTGQDVEDGAGDAADDEDTGEIADGTYVGEVVLGIAIPNYSIVASRVEITISDGVVDIVMDSTLDAGLEYVSEGGGPDVLVCSAVARMIYTGTGVANTSIEIPIQLQSIEILSVSGECEDSPLSHFDEAQIFIFSATYSDGTFTGQTFEGLYGFTARFQP